MANQKPENGIETQPETAPTGNPAQQADNTAEEKRQSPPEKEAIEDESLSKKIASAINPNVQACIYAALAVLVTAFLLFGVIGKNQVLDRLSHIEHARGLITFILSVGTISIAILVTIGALMGRDADARDRFYRAKEILTILIGVLGTIVGFYFGSQESATGRADLVVAAPILSAYTVGPGDAFTLTSFVSGGSPPYKYEIAFQDNLIESIRGYTDDAGWVTQTIKAPQAVKKETIQYSLLITDAGQKTVSYISAKGKHIVVEPR